MTTVLADYEDERKAFGALFKKDCKERILLYRGVSGSGKTTLLTYCKDNLIPKGVIYYPVALKESSVGLTEILLRSADLLTMKNMKYFADAVAELDGKPSVNIDKNSLAGIANRISVVIQVDNKVDREQRLARLTSAWFEDLKAYQKPILIVFDQYEKGGTEIKEWIEGPLLSRVVTAENVRVIVAGQSVPEENNIAWGSCCSAHVLKGVKEHRHWMPVIKAMKRKFSKDIKDPESYLHGICDVLNGNPSAIKQYIEALPTD